MEVGRLASSALSAVFSLADLPSKFNSSVSSHVKMDIISVFSVGPLGKSNGIKYM